MPHISFCIYHSDITSWFCFSHILFTDIVILIIPYWFYTVNNHNVLITDISAPITNKWNCMKSNQFVFWAWPGSTMLLGSGMEWKNHQCSLSTAVFFPSWKFLLSPGMLSWKIQVPTCGWIHRWGVLVKAQPASVHDPRKALLGWCIRMPWKLGTVWRKYFIWLCEKFHEYRTKFT